MRSKEIPSSRIRNRKFWEEGSLTGLEWGLGRLGLCFLTPDPQSLTLVTLDF